MCVQKNFKVSAARESEFFKDKYQGEEIGAIKVRRSLESVIEKTLPHTKPNHMIT